MDFYGSFKSVQEIVSVEHGIVPRLLSHRTFPNLEIPALNACIFLKSFE
jgi:hypothetical protein